MGRRKKISKELITKISQGIKIGLTNEEAANLAGISKSTFYGYMELAEKIEKEEKVSEDYKIFLDFLESIMRAKAEAQGIYLESILRASRNNNTTKEVRTTFDDSGCLISKVVIEKEHPKSWQAAAWWIERRDKKEKETTGLDGGQNDNINFYIPENSKEV